jgi:hypothetical protein
MPHTYNSRHLLDLGAGQHLGLPHEVQRVQQPDAHAPGARPRGVCEPHLAGEPARGAAVRF